MNYTAAGLGNHEFDDSVDGLVPFVTGVNYDILGVNVVEHGEKRLTQHVKSSQVYEFEGGDYKVGIIGYVTTDSAFISSPGDTISFVDVVTAVGYEARHLKSTGVNFIIALGHNGYNEDVEMAKRIPELDVVVGGHSHTFLYSGEVPSVEKPQGEYPTYVKQSNGKVVPVVQAYAYSKYIGHFR